MPEYSLTFAGSGVCIVCKQPVRGGFEVEGRKSPDGPSMIVVKSTPDRDFNVCDLCNRTVHFHCSGYPDSGYCDDCYAKVERATQQPSNH
jgi:hypothetical protein